MLSESNNSINKIVDFHLADDIIQGENIPFYLLWEGENPTEIHIIFEGFKSLTELHNSDIKNAIFESDKIVINSFETDGYLGGVLSTNTSEKSNLDGNLKIKFIQRNDSPIILEESRILYGTTISLTNNPSVIHISNTENGISEKIELILRGKTTVFFAIEELDTNGCNIDVPSDVKTELDKMTSILNRGLVDLSNRFPEHSEIIEMMLNLQEEKISTSLYLEEIETRLEDSFKDEDFVEAFVTLFLTTFYQNNSLEDVLIKPLNEYFETYSKQKAYFSNPLLSVNLPAGSCQLAIKLVSTNLIDKECREPIEIITKIQTDTEISMPIRELFNLRRTNG